MLVPKLDAEGKEQFDEKNELIMFEDGKEAPSKTHTDEAFRAVSDDMHKYKDAKRKAELEIETLKKQINNVAKDELIAKEKYKELYEAEVKRTNELENELASKEERFINVHKKQEVIQKLGGFKRSEYNKFIDTSRIIMQDNGDVDETTVEVEVKRLKQEYPELLKRSKGSILPNNAPESGDSIGSKPLNKMSKNERNTHRRDLIEKRYLAETNNE